MSLKQTVFFVCMAVLLFLGACKKETTDPSFIDIPVVQSYLVSGQVPTLNVSRMVPYSGTAIYSPDDINALSVQITCNDTVHTLKPRGNGNYSDSTFLISKNGKYALSFVYNGKTVSATTSIPSKPVGYTQSVDTMTIAQVTTTGGGGGFGGSTYRPNPIQLNWSNTNASYYVVVVENIETNPLPINPDETSPPRIFRNQPTQGNQYQIQSRQFHYYGIHRLLLFHLNPDYAALYNNNGTNSQTLTNPATNLTNGLGIFTGLTADTLFMKILP